MISDARIVNSAVLAVMQTRSSEPKAAIQRRALLKRIVTGFSLVGLGFLTYPFLRHWVPSWQSDGSREVDLSMLEPGESLSVPWLGREVKVLKRSAAQIRALSNPVEPLKDPESIDSEQPYFAQNLIRSERDTYFVFYAECTHLGCAVSVRRDQDAPITCPCHQSHFDASGRVTAGSAATANLEVPNYRHLAANAIVLLEPSDEDSGST